MNGTINYPHLLSRLCAPLAIEQRGFQSILTYLGPRLGLDLSAAAESVLPAKNARNFPDIPENIAAIEVCGPLVRRASGLDALCGLSGYEAIENDFEEAMADPSKQAVLMLFDSPGGEVGGLFDLADLIYSNRGQKPIYAAVAESAFSAAYALASACDRVFLTRTAGVGSIGVFSMHVDVSEMDKKEGTAYTYIFAGQKKIEGNPHEPLSAEARSTIQSEVDRSYQMFVECVARNRKLSEKKVRTTEAGLYFGQDGVDSGLADEVGTVSEVIAALQEAIAPNGAPAASSRAQSEIPEAPRAAEAANPTQEANMAKVDTAALAAEKEPCADDEEMKSKKSETPKKDNEGEPDEDDKAKAADAKEVVFLCEVAKRPELVGSFIKKGLTLSQVRKDLLSAQAAEQQAPGAIGHHVAAVGGQNPVDQLDSMAKARAASKGIGYSKAYAEVMKENAGLYKQYLDQKDAALKR